MFESISIETLQTYCWIIISLLGGLLVFLMFVQGGQTLLYTIGKTEPERKLLGNIIGRKWIIVFITFATFGGAFSASFPLFSSTSFGGAYWVWTAILVAFILQAVAYGFRGKFNSFPSHKIHQFLLIITGLPGMVLTGSVFATFFTGSSFLVNKPALTNLADPAIAHWMNPAHGLEAMLNWRNVALGLALFFLSRVLGILYFMNKIVDEPMVIRVKKQLIINTIPFLIFFLPFVFAIFTMPGYAVRPQDGFIFGEPYKYFHNLTQMPAVMMMFAAGFVFVLLGVALPLLSFEKNASSGFRYAGAGTVLMVFALFCLAGLNQTAYYPSTYDLPSSLTIRNSSSSLDNLMVMGYASLLLPLVIAYIGYSWKSVHRKTDASEIEEERPAS
jgi:cytochrome d ubiquinol oxidase subunit II